MSQALYVFWAYDQFPYVLGGYVEAVLPDGRVKLVTRSYGGMTVHPLVLLPVAAGEAVHAKLATLEADHRAALAELHRTHLTKLTDYAPWALPTPKKAKP